MANIPGVPDFITKSQLSEVLGTLGLSMRDLVSLRFEMDGIKATVMARNSEGKHYTAGPDYEAAKHVISIEFRDE